MSAFVQMLKDIVHQQIIFSTQIGNGKFQENYLKGTVRNECPNDNAKFVFIFVH